MAGCNGEAPLAKECTTNRSDLRHQTSQRRQAAMLAPHIKHAGGGDEKHSGHVPPRQAYRTLAVAGVLHHASFHGISGHL